MTDSMNGYASHPEWVRKTLNDLDGVAWTTGIDGNRKRTSWTSVNVDVHDVNSRENVMVVQVRWAHGRSNRFTRVRKQYYFCGRNENGNAFAHPVSLTSTNARVTAAQAKIWDTTEATVREQKIVRHGDVALIPLRHKPDFSALTALGRDEWDGHFAVADSHVVTPEILFSSQDGSYAVVGGHVEIRHTKSQHPDVSVDLPRGKYYRVQHGIRAAAWRFTSPTAD